jgi:hypothetical protein
VPLRPQLVLVSFYFSSSLPIQICSLSSLSFMSSMATPTPPSFSSSVLDALRLRQTWFTTKKWVQTHADTLAWLLVGAAGVCLAVGAVYLFWQRRSPVAHQHVDVSCLGELDKDETVLVRMQGTWFEHFRLDNPSHYGNWFVHRLQHVTMQCRLVERGDRAGFVQLLNTGVDARGQLHSQTGMARPVAGHPSILLASFVPFVETSIVVLHVDSTMLVLGDPEHGSLRLLTRDTNAPALAQLQLFHTTAEAHGYTRAHNLNERVKRTVQGRAASSS